METATRAASLTTNGHKLFIRVMCLGALSSILGNLIHEAVKGERATMGWVIWAGLVATYLGAVKLHYLE